jgi:hypothetical protein
MDYLRKASNVYTQLGRLEEPTHDTAQQQVSFDLCVSERRVEEVRYLCVSNGAFH